MLQELNNKNNLYIDTTFYELVSFDLKKAIKKSSKHNIVLEGGDSIVITKKLDVVQIKGDLINLKTPQLVPFLGKRAFIMLKIIGGLLMIIKSLIQQLCIQMEQRRKH